VRALRPDVPEALATTLGRMLAKDPAGRPAAAVELRKTLEAIQAVQPATPAPRRQPGREKLVKALGFLALMIFVLCIGIGGGLLFRHLRREMHDRNWRIDRVRTTISEGYRALDKGDIDAALEKSEELSAIRGSPDEWEFLGREIAAFEKAVRLAASRQGEVKER
jgi:hypothetical protein